MYYFSDTSRCWDNSRYNLRDHVSSKGSAGVATTDDLTDFLRTAKQSVKGALLTHSNFWVADGFSWWSNRFLFWGLNRIKSIKKKRLASRRRHR